MCLLNSCRCISSLFDTSNVRSKENPIKILNTTNFFVFFLEILVLSCIRIFVFTSLLLEHIFANVKGVSRLFCIMFVF